MDCGGGGQEDLSFQNFGPPSSGPLGGGAAGGRRDPSPHLPIPPTPPHPLSATSPLTPPHTPKAIGGPWEGGLPSQTPFRPLPLLIHPSGGGEGIRNLREESEFLEPVNTLSPQNLRDVRVQ